MRLQSCSIYTGQGVSHELSKPLEPKRLVVFFKVTLHGTIFNCDHVTALTIFCARVKIHMLVLRQTELR